jgi:hypothetical protein
MSRFFQIHIAIMFQLGKNIDQPLGENSFNSYVKGPKSV